MSAGPWLLFVAPADYDRKIETIHADGHWLNWGNSGTGPGQFPGVPDAVAVDPRSRTVDVAVYDYAIDQHSRIEKFNEDGHFIRERNFTDRNGKPTPVHGVAVDPAGDVLAVGERSCVQKFTSTGQFVTQFGCSLPWATGLAANSHGDVFVADPTTQTGSVFLAIYADTTIVSGPTSGRHWSDPTPSFAFKSSQPGGGTFGAGSTRRRGRRVPRRTRRAISPTASTGSRSARSTVTG